MGSSDRRPALHAAMICLVIACATTACREFPLEAPRVPAMQPLDWPSEVAVSDTFVLALEIVVPPGDRVRSLPIRFESSDPRVLEVTVLPPPDTIEGASGLQAPRARAVARQRGTVEIIVTIPEDHGLQAAELRRTIRVSEKWIWLSAGFRHACGVTVAREAYCWGFASGSGFLGDGSSAGSLTPARVIGGLAFTRIEAGGDHTCATRPDDLMFCWGVNDRGAVGDGSTNDQLAPVAVLQGPRFENFSAGWGHTCGVSDIATGVCWGDARQNQLGSADVDDLCSGEPCSLGPVVVKADPDDVLEDLLRFTHVSAGRDYTCGVALDGRAWCWGSNARGGLGTGTLASSDTAVAVAANVTFRTISTGWFHACGVTTADEVYCWGTNQFGELGVQQTTTACDGLPCNRTPVRVNAPAAAQVSVRHRNTCILSLDGRIHCWGLNDRDQLGAPSAEMCAGRACSRTPLEVAVDPEQRYTRVSVGESFACAISTRGFAYCWGEAQEGKLGSGQETGTQPIPGRVLDPEEG